MLIRRQASLLLLAALASGCAALGDGRGSTSFDVVDANDDGTVDIGEFRRQNLFPPYEQFFYEADADGSESLDPEEFHIAESMVNNAMGVGGVDV